MKVTERPALKAFNTFGVEASAGLLITLENEEDLLSLPTFDPRRDIVLGGGSNIMFASDVPGSVAGKLSKPMKTMRGSRQAPVRTGTTWCGGR